MKKSNTPEKVEEKTPAQQNTEEIMNLLERVHQQLALQEFYSDPERLNRFLIGRLNDLDQRMANLELYSKEMAKALNAIGGILNAAEVQK